MENKIVFELTDEDANFLISCLERYLEKLTEAGLMREVSKLIEKIDDQI